MALVGVALTEGCGCHAARRVALRHVTVRTCVTSRPLRPAFIRCAAQRPLARRTQACRCASVASSTTVAPKVTTTFHAWVSFYSEPGPGL
eukprot:scaffold42884_cov41-Phaeocystis_antarctica.AAC.1